MQSSSKQAPYFYLTISGILILLQIILFALANEIWQILLLIVLAALIVYMNFHFLFFYIQSDASLFQNVFFANRMIQSIFLRRNACLTVKNGEVDQDYFLLSTKPRRAGIYIESDSAVVVTDTKGSLRSFGCGFHTLQSGEQLSASFPLNMQTVNCGPQKGENWH